MSNQFERLKNREQDAKEKDMNRKIENLLEAMHQAVIKYSYTYFFFLEQTDNGSLLPKMKTTRARTKDILASNQFLHQKNVLVEQIPFTFFKKKVFIKEIEAKQKEIGIQMIPLIMYNGEGMIPSFGFKELRSTNPEPIPAP